MLHQSFNYRIYKSFHATKYNIFNKEYAHNISLVNYAARCKSLMRFDGAAWPLVNLMRNVPHNHVHTCVWMLACLLQNDAIKNRPLQFVSTPPTLLPTAVLLAPQCECVWITGRLHGFGSNFYEWTNPKPNKTFFFDRLADGCADMHKVLYVFSFPHSEIFSPLIHSFPTKFEPHSYLIHFANRFISWCGASLFHSATSAKLSTIR